MPSGAAPLFAGVAASAVVVAARFRRPQVLAGLVRAGVQGRPGFLGRVGSLAFVGTVTGTQQLRLLLHRAGSGYKAERLAGMAALVSAGIALACVWIGGGPLIVAPLLVLATLRAPVFLAARTARHRLRAIERDVPLLLDVLFLASFAGLPPRAALNRAVSAIDGPLADELSAALGDVELGARWRDRLARLVDDVPVPDLRRAVTLLLRAEAIGASTTESIAVLAEDVRATRRAAASERARKAPVQMLFPLVFLVLPAFLLLTVVPVLVATLGSIR